MKCFSYQTKAPHSMLSTFDGILLMKFMKYGGRPIRTFGGLITQQIAPKTRYRTGQGLMKNAKPAKIEKTTARSVALTSLPLNKDCTLSPVVAMSPSVVWIFTPMFGSRLYLINRMSPCPFVGKKIKLFSQFINTISKRQLGVYVRKLSGPLPVTPSPYPGEHEKHRS